MRYFTTTVIPDVINGDVSTVIQSGKTDLAMGNNDILFDWTSFDIPKGAARVESISLYIMGEDGGIQNYADISLIFAKSENGEAPSSLGNVNAAQTAGFDMPTHFIGATKLEGSGVGIGVLGGPSFGNIYVSNSTNGNGHVNTGLILEGEPNSGANVGYDTIYVAGMCGSPNIDFSTGVLADGAVTSDSATSITTKTVDPRKCFQIGDTVYLHDVDTALGTVASMTATNITLNAAIAGGTDIADEDELVNANPIRMVIGFSK